MLWVQSGKELLTINILNGTHNTWNFPKQNPQHLDVTWTFTARRGCWSSLLGHGLCEQCVSRALIQGEAVGQWPVKNQTRTASETTNAERICDDTGCARAGRASSVLALGPGEAQDCSSSSPLVAASD